MAAKQDRYKKLPALKGKKTTPSGKQKSVKLTDAEIAEGAAASEKIAKRPTKDFSREELGALMQTAPGGAEPHQINTQSRQFNRISGDLPTANGVDDRTGTKATKRVLPNKTPKIDPED